MTEIAERLEDRIAFDETDWAIRVGNLQLAVMSGCEDWYSEDGRYRYKLTSTDPSENDPADLDRVDSDEINPGSWTVAVTDLTKPPHGSNRRQYLDSTCITIDEGKRVIQAFDIKAGNFENSRDATFHDVALLSRGLDELSIFLGR